MERENRKVLISVKVSTLLLILIAIIIFIVLTNIIKDKIQTHTNLAANTNYNEENITQEVAQSNRIINAKVSSRGTVSEEQRVSREVVINDVTNEETEKVTNEEITPELANLYGSLGTLNFENTIENSIGEIVAKEPETTPIEEVTISKDMDLTIRTGLSRDDFITLISNVKEDKNNFFEDNAGLIYDVCEENQINEIFFCGLIASESGWHIADNHRRTHNYISLMSGGSLIKYSSVEDGLRESAKTLHDNYLSKDGKFYYGSTLNGIKTKFCPSSSTWTNLVYKNMEKIIK